MKTRRWFKNTSPVSGPRGWNTQLKIIEKRSMRDSAGWGVWFGMLVSAGVFGMSLCCRRGKGRSRGCPA